MNTVSAQPKPPLVLMVDDDPTMRMQLRLCLEREGYQIAEAKNGREGLDLCETYRPDLILLDAMMPDIDGLDDQTSVDRAFAAGASDYVTKPVHWAVLRQRLRRLIQQTQLQIQLEQANQELQRLATMDGLTKVANRRRFDQYLQQEWHRMQREQLPLSLILCDIDFFKLYNDHYGHQAGDRCLYQVAQSIESSIRRPADLVARYGGEEFAIILPNTHPQGASHVAHLVGEHVKALAIPHGSSTVSTHITLSAGATGMVPCANSSIEILIATADRALYRAKAEGRDRCCLNLPPDGSLST
ncbi:MAG: diguanylate cyclase [Oculatellaceae cyanobacterium Prado106]|nr:diguanylate cyclase [Oculatellaceae cyanobacterium Prado106]